jgi:hypothetical protein
MAINPTPILQQPLFTSLWLGTHDVDSGVGEFSKIALKELLLQSSTPYCSGHRINLEHVTN